MLPKKSDSIIRARTHDLEVNRVLARCVVISNGHDGKNGKVALNAESLEISI
jgi:hypothetical protein